MMMTELSMILKKIRLENGQVLKKMADSLQVTSSYLSAVENGKRPMPKEWLGKLKESYSLNDEIVEAIRLASDKLAKSVKISLENTSDEKRDVALVFARTFDNMDDAIALKIKEMLMKEDD